MLENSIYGIFSSECDVTLTPDGADAFLEVNTSENGIRVSRLNIGSGAKIEVNDAVGNALSCKWLNVGPRAELDADGGWHGLDITDGVTIGEDAVVNARGNHLGIWVRFCTMTLEKGAVVNASSHDSRYSSAALDVSMGKVLVKNGATLNAYTDDKAYGVELDDGSITVEAGGKLNVINDKSDGLGLMMGKNSFVQFNSTDVTISGGSAAIVGDGEIRRGTGIATQHRDSAADEWEMMTENQTDLRFLRTVEAADVPQLPKTGDESSLLLWTAMACISLLGMTALARRRKEA